MYIYIYRERDIFMYIYLCTWCDNRESGQPDPTGKRDPGATVDTNEVENDEPSGPPPGTETRREPAVVTASGERRTGDPLVWCLYESRTKQQEEPGAPEHRATKSNLYSICKPDGHTCIPNILCISLWPHEIPQQPSWQRAVESSLANTFPGFLVGENWDNQVCICFKKVLSRSVQVLKKMKSQKVLEICYIHVFIYSPNRWISTSGTIVWSNYCLSFICVI